jgi:diguanylate cyclase (GGDEF)-like protein/PAS domain S-box-containing protein
LSTAVPVKKDRPGRDGFPLRLVVAAFVISVLAATIGSMLLWRLHDRFDATQTREIQLDEYVGQVKLLDEALTMSARIAAATGDASYEARYDKLDGELDALIKKTAAALGLAGVKEFVEQTDVANQKLVQMERRAFALMHEGKRAEAVALLVSDEYKKWKDVYAEGVEKTVAWQSAAIQRDKQNLYRMTVGFAILSGVIALALFSTWYFAIRAGRRWRQERLESEAALRQARDELDLRVQDRTGALQSANAALRQKAETLAHEIEERKRGETELRKSREIIAAILDATPARIFWKDRNLVYLGCNAPFAHDAGFSRPEEIIGKDDYQMAWRVHADKYRGDDREVIDSNRSKLLIDEPLITLDGKTTTILTSKVPLRDPNGEIFGVLGTYLDVTERARLEEQLKTRNLQFDAALNNMAQGLLMFDREGKLLISNRRFAELFKLPWEKWKTASQGKTVIEGMRLASEWTEVTEKNQEHIIAELRGALELKEVRHIVFERTDGSTFSSSAAPMGDGGFVVTFDDITEQRRTEEKIAHMAHYDALTDLPNRVLFYEKLQQHLAHARRTGSFAVLSLDLDRFKSVNDMLGHPVGDQLLQTAAQRMRSCVRDGDIVSRLGGDEFAIVQATFKQPADATVLATRLIDTVSAPYDIDGHQVVVGASVGIAIAPTDGTTPDQIMKNADLALYRCKADRGNVYRFFEPQMDARMQQRRALELDLRNALINGEFTVNYQPIVNLKTGAVTACEALIRWHQPERGLVPPLEFIPIAEETGLIVPIGEWVLGRACADAAEWPDEIAVAVNVSPAQFKAADFVRVVKDALAKSQFPASRLELEITELVLIQDSDGALAMLRQLKELGVSVAMDDFGTGYSSLGYLRSFPFDRIKIDQSFIRDLSKNKQSLAILRAVVGLGSSLDIVTTAEGVETQNQLEVLRAEGCTDVQGFFFTPPKSAEETKELLTELHGRVSAIA